MAAPDIRRTIQNEMRASFPVVEERVARFYAMQEYQLGWRDEQLRPADVDPGKLLRPRLVLLACQAVGGDAAQALPLAAGIQLLHDFTLIHDDIEDNSDTRRGRITLWRQWGLAQGINAGDGMFVVAHLALQRLADSGTPPALVLEVLRRFDQTILTICEGQFLDLSFEGNLGIDEEDYLAMIGRKTAVLLAAAAGLGALVGGGNTASVAALWEYGRSLGLAFQIQDDLLGIWGDPEVTGKPRAADLYRRKVSLPVVYALRQSDEAGELARLYRQEQLNDADTWHALAVLDASGARAYCEELAVRHHQQALDNLAQMQPGGTGQAALQQLRALTEGLLGRQA